MNDFNSNYKSIEYDVPRGSVLEPLLFIFINDVVLALKSPQYFLLLMTHAFSCRFV